MCWFVWLWSLGIAWASDCDAAEQALAEAKARGDDLTWLQAARDDICSEVPPTHKQRPQREHVIDPSRTRAGWVPFRTKILRGHHAALTRIGLLPMGLKVLDLSGSSVRRLPVLPLTLQALSVRGLPLTRLPALPDSIRVLDLRGSDVRPIKRPGALECMVVDNPTEAFEVSRPESCPAFADLLGTD